MKTKTLRLDGLFFKKEIQEILDKVPDDACFILKGSILIFNHKLCPICKKNQCFRTSKSCRECFTGKKFRRLSLGARTK